MKILVDSGSTKADWISIDDQGKTLFTTQTLGLNPEVLSKDEIVARLNDRFDILQNKSKVSHLYFYGAGCGTDRMKNFLADVFREYFPMRPSVYTKIHMPRCLRQRLKARRRSFASWEPARIAVISTVMFFTKKSSRLDTLQWMTVRATSLGDS